jgi:hypothetical protein
MFWQVLSGLLLFTLFTVYAWLIVHARTESVYRPIALSVCLSSIPIMVVVFGLVLGTAIPTGWFVFQMPAGEYRLLGCKSVPKEGIYVMLDEGDYKTPRFYRMPWDRDLSMAIEEKGCRGLLNVKGTNSPLETGAWEFTWNTEAPRVTNEDTAEKFFPDKILPESAPGMVLPPAD